MSQNDHSFTGVARRIETLTNILQHIHHKMPPTNEHDDIPPFLRHFTTLLTYGDESDKEAKRINAVTGTFKNGNMGLGVKALVVTQNPKPSSDVVGIKKVMIGLTSFDDVVKRTKPRDLQEHIEDICIALSTCNPLKQLGDLQIFITNRCYHKLRTKFNLYKKLFGTPLDDEIKKWDSQQQELNESQWFNVPAQLYKHLPPGVKINSRTHGQTQLQWEFSDDSKGGLSLLLAKLISQVDKAFQAVDDRIGPEVTPEQKEAYRLLNAWLTLLRFYVQSGGPAELLLTRTSLSSVIVKAFKNAPDEDSEDMLPEVAEHCGRYILRYLRAIVAWNTAASVLVKPFHGPVNIRNIDIRLVEVPHRLREPLTLVQMMGQYSLLFPGSGELLGPTTYPPRFGGTIHAEAALMGLYAYFTSKQPGISHEESVDNISELQEVLEVTGNMYIAAGKKCCWCCDRLAYHLGKHLQVEFKLLGTHGVLHAWSPPTIGIDVSVLEALENDLWNELNSTLISRAPHEAETEELTDFDGAFDALEELGIGIS